MAGKMKFRIPTAEEMENADTAVCIQSMAVCESYKNRGEDESERTSTGDSKLKSESSTTTVTGGQQSGVSHSDSSNNSSLRRRMPTPSDSTLTKEQHKGIPKISESGKISKSETGSMIGSTNTGTVQISSNQRSTNMGTVQISSNQRSTNTGTVPAIKKVGSAPLKVLTGKTSSIIVNARQRGNPILKHIRNVPWEFGDIVPDYVVGQTNCALFLSLRYHQLNPGYIHDRLKQLGQSFDLRVLLVQVDIKEPHHLLKDLAKICILAECTLMLAFSAEEAGRYLEAYKVYENKPPEALMEKTDSDFQSKLTDCLTTVKAVNKTDCMTLVTAFGSLEKIMGSSADDLSWCPGIGPQKAQRLHDVFREPFIRAKKRKTDHGQKSGMPDEQQPNTSKENPQK